MEKLYITAEEVERALLIYERRYGIPTVEFYEQHLASDPRLDEIPRRHRATWASLHRTLERLSAGGDLASRIERDLEPV